MKNIIFQLILACVLFFVACEKDETKVKYSDEPSGPVMTLPVANANMQLLVADSAKYIQFAWDKADFGFSSAATYQLELDSVGGDFSDPIVILSTTSSKDSIMLYTFNGLLYDNGYAGEKAYDVNIRIRSILKGIDGSEFADTVFSAMHRVNITPFTVIEYGPQPSIYMVGGIWGNWDLAKAVEVAASDEKDIFSTIAYFSTANGGYFRFFSAPSWASSIGGSDAFPDYPTDLLNAANDGDKNFIFKGTEGWYNVTANMKDGVLTMVPVSEPLLYLTGDATHGWNFGETATPLKWVGHQIWEGDIAFTQNNYFRCFEQADWGPVNYGYNKLTEYDTDVIIIAVGHGDPNWQFIAPSGSYHVKVDKRAGTIVIIPNV